MFACFSSQCICFHALSLASSSFWLSIFFSDGLTTHPRSPCVIFCGCTMKVKRVQERWMNTSITCFQQKRKLREHTYRVQKKKKKKAITIKATWHFWPHVHPTFIGSAIMYKNLFILSKFSWNEGEHRLKSSSFYSIYSKMSVFTDRHQFILEHQLSWASTEGSPTHLNFGIKSHWSG